MPHAIADSDDDGDDIDYVAAERSNSSSGSAAVVAPGCSNETHGIDGTNERSTGSTEILKRQMLSAERKLLTNSAPTPMAVKQQSSPSVLVQKRRHTAAFASEPIAAGSGNGGVKRTKTPKTYGAKGSSQVTDDSTFERLRDEAGTGPGPRTSQSARFTEHSAFIHSSAELPPASFPPDFANHEPSVLFKDTGSTVEDTSSAQQRLVEQAVGGTKVLSTSAINALVSEEQGSSSIPWSAEEQTRSARSTADGVDQQVDVDDGGMGETIGKGGGSGDAGMEDTMSRILSALGKEGHDMDDATKGHDSGKKHSSARSPEIHPDSPDKLHLSPSVEIEVLNTKKRRLAAPTDVESSTQKPTLRGRTRKSEAELLTDPLNSEDKAIGLPKERYQPRPSRRRATAVLEEPIDYSVRPEKAAKVKRTKTANVTASFDADARSQVDQNVEDAHATPDTRQPGDEVDGDIQPSKRKPEKSQSDKDEKQSEDKEDNTPGGSSQLTNKMSVSHEQKSDDHIFVKPAMPTPKAKSGPRAKRSHTTIFEDHVEFVGSQRSPSLSQQQANRTSALQDVRNESDQSIQRKRRTVVMDEDDDEDELAKDVEEPTVDEEDAAPKKRGRGRPAKKTQAKSTERVLEDSNDEEDDPTVSDEAPKKKGHGRPAKTASSSDSGLVKDKEVDEPNDSNEATNCSSLTSGAEAPNKPAETVKPTEKATRQIEVHPTPSPEKNEKAPGSTPQKAVKPSPAHSPIKSSLKAPLRVGLSKRHRIPSLLRTMNPAKR